MFCDSDNSSEPPESDRPGGAEIRRFGGRENPVCFLIQSVSQSGHFGPPEGRGPRRGVFGGSETGRPQGRPERPRRRSTTRSKSTRSSRLCSVSLSSVLSRSVLLRDVVVGKISFSHPEVGLVFFWCPEVGLENYIATSGDSRWTRSRRRSSQSSSVNRRRSILRIGSWTQSKTCAPPQPQREREFRTILNRPLDTSKLKF